MAAETERDQVKRNIRALLAHHQGPNDCIKMIDLHREATGDTIIPKRAYDQSRLTRSIVEELRREGLAIGIRLGPDGGYFLARSDEELRPTIALFHERAMASLKQEAQLKRIPFGQLLEQYQLEFEQQQQEVA